MYTWRTDSDAVFPECSSGSGKTPQAWLVVRSGKDRHEDRSIQLARRAAVDSLGEYPSPCRTRETIATAPDCSALLESKRRSSRSPPPGPDIRPVVPQRRPPSTGLRIK